MSMYIMALSIENNTAVVDRVLGLVNFGRYTDLNYGVKINKTSFKIVCQPICIPWTLRHASENNVFKIAT